MKLTLCFVLVNLLIIVQSLNSQMCSDYNPNRTESIATALVKLLETLSLRNAPLIYVRFHFALPCQLEYIFQKMMEQNRGKFLVQNVNFPANDPWTFEIQPILAISHCDDLNFLLFSPFMFEPVLMFCPGKTAEQFRTFLEQFNYEHPIGRNIKILFEHEDKFIDLWSIVHFTRDQSRCQKLQLVHTNRFSIEQNSWQSTAIRTEPQRDFYGCEMRVSIFNYPNTEKYILHKYHEYDNGSLEVGGLYVDVMRIAAQTLNFSIYFNAIGSKYNNKYHWFYQDNIILDENFLHFRHSSEFLFSIDFMFLIPPGELYSDAEKLFMPLELEVWVATLVTISVALLTVQIINRLSKKVQNLVFGRNVTTPTLNIMIAFVGGAQTTLPRRNFARFLLILFIFFSIIIRTCFQSKLFEYLQADFVKREIQTIDELFEQNFTIYTHDKNQILLKALGFKSENIKFFVYNQTREVYEMTLDPNLKVAIFTLNFDVAIVKSQFSAGITSLKTLKQIGYKGFTPFTHKPLSFVKEQINDMIGRCHSGGLINLWLERYFKFKQQPLESKPTALSMDHLKAGFVVVCLPLVAAFVAFVGEMVSTKIKKQQTIANEVFEMRVLNENQVKNRQSTLEEEDNLAPIEQIEIKRIKVTTTIEVYHRNEENVTGTSTTTHVKYERTSEFERKPQQGSLEDLIAAVINEN